MARAAGHATRRVLDRLCGNRHIAISNRNLKPDPLNCLGLQVQINVGAGPATVRSWAHIGRICKAGKPMGRTRRG